MAKISETKWKSELMNTEDGRVAVVITGKVTGIVNEVVMQCKPAKKAEKAIEAASQFALENGISVKMPKLPKA